MSGPKSREPIHILGAGSIGLLWASSIRSKIPDYPVTLLLRDHHRPRLAPNDKLLHFDWSRPHQDKTPVTIPVQFMKDDEEPIQNLVVTTKSYQAKGAVESIIDRLDPTSSKIILLCNGALSVSAELADVVQGIPLVFATTTHGAYQEQDKSHLVHAGIGKTFIQEHGDNIESMTELWNSADLNCQILPSDKMQDMLWDKLAVNCVINPLTALFKCTNGELLMEPAFPELQHEILSEVAQVFQAGNRSTTQEFLRQFVSQVIHDTHENKSSMYQDVLRNQPTEIDHLNGYVVRMGRKLNVECPANDEIVHRVKELLK
jgi:2-dehydropantoate 2-reductase